MHKDRVHMLGKIIFSQDKTHLVVRMALFYIFQISFVSGLIEHSSLCAGFGLQFIRSFWLDAEAASLT